MTSWNENWDSLEYWQTGKWQVVQENLDDAENRGRIICPKREDLFKALDLTPFEKVKVMVVGQDPYPDPLFATGVAFSIPKGLTEYPVTLANIFREYSASFQRKNEIGGDLHYPYPKSGNLEKWSQEGVLLWNAIPSCLKGKSLSHDWPEWHYLTTEIIEKLCARDKPGVFVFLGGVARSFVKCVNKERWKVIELSHPSPRGNLTSRSPFLGSRMFTTINAYLCELKVDPVNWRLS